MKKLFFISGLPRSGSTLLTNILLQNKKIHATSSSSLLELLIQVRDNWNRFEGHRTNPNGQDKWRVINSISQNYHNTNKKIIFDKNRGWPTHIEFIEKSIGEKAKIIACVRNIEDVCASFEKIYRKNRSDGEINYEFSNPKMRSVEGRVEVWVSENGVVGRSYIQLHDAFMRDLGDRILIFPYEEWTKEPDKWFDMIYDFIGETKYKHDFDNIQQLIYEDDSEYEWGKDLHEIKTGKLIPAHSVAEKILGKKSVSKLHDSEFWKKT